MSTISKSALRKIERAILRGFRPSNGFCGPGEFLRAGQGKTTSRAQRNRRFRNVKFAGPS
jgi:hypothetical protein